MQAKPIGMVKEIVQTAGLRVSCSYDDLIFTEDNSLILQFDKKDKKRLRFYINSACESPSSDKLEKRLGDAAQEAGYTVTKSGEFEIEKKKGSEETEIRLLPY
ncbi:MAG: hypothetical protein JW927_14100 [Deltaproteobacteria bacterium]|nr:hypothetical protein [Deltaproteobacteria bacterium]